MRIVHLSDIHLSKDNIEELKNNYVEALQKILTEINKEKKIDIITITGDLVDKGGNSLLTLPEYSSITNPYFIFEKEFINPIKQHLSLDNSKFIFIPGNHDVDESKILWVDEKQLKKDIDYTSVDKFLDKNRLSINNFNKRIENFKEFEKYFHQDIIGTDYNFSLNESTYIHNYEDEYSIGFALINDSWRCSTCRLWNDKDEKIYFGKRQLYDALKIFKGANTTINIALLHHPFELYHEAEEVERILSNKDFHLFLIGHSHRHKYKNIIDGFGGCYGFMARAALNNPSEKDSTYQSGFQTIDINFTNSKIDKISYYKYIYSACRFDVDIESAPKGVDVRGYDLGLLSLTTKKVIPVKDLIKDQFFKK